MMRTLLTLAALLLAASAAAAGGEVAPELVVKLRPAAAAAGGFVRLDEVAELSGTRAADAAGVLLGRAPDAGERRALTARTVGLRLEEEGFDARRFDVAGAAETVVRPAGDPTPAATFAPATTAAGEERPAAPSGDELKQLATGWLRSALAARLSCPVDDLDVRIDSLRATGLAADPADTKAEVQWPAGHVRLGRQSATILLSAGNQSLGRLQVSLDAGVYRTVPVASRDLTAGRAIAADDVSQARLRLTDLALEIPNDVALLPGMIVRRGIRAGAPLDARSLERPAIVRRGQPVTLVLESDGVRITEPAVARSDAGLGEAVTIERLGSHRMQLVGKVAGQGLVKLEQVP